MRRLARRSVALLTRGNRLFYFGGAAVFLLGEGVTMLHGLFPPGHVRPAMTVVVAGWVAVERDLWVRAFR